MSGGRASGEYLWQAKEGKKFWEVPPVWCRVTKSSGVEVNCKSEAEFNALIVDLIGG